MPENNTVNPFTVDDVVAYQKTAAIAPTTPVVDTQNPFTAGDILAYRQNQESQKQQLQEQ